MSQRASRLDDVSDERNQMGWQEMELPIVYHMGYHSGQFWRNSRLTRQGRTQLMVVVDWIGLLIRTKCLDLELFRAYCLNWWWGIGCCTWKVFQINEIDESSEKWRAIDDGSSRAAVSVVLMPRDVSSILRKAVVALCLCWRHFSALTNASSSRTMFLDQQCYKRKCPQQSKTFARLKPQVGAVHWKVRATMFLCTNVSFY